MTGKVVVLQIGRVASITSDDEIRIPVAELMRHDAWGISGLKAEYSIRVAPVMDGRGGEPKRFACALMCSEGR